VWHGIDRSDFRDDDGLRQGAAAIGVDTTVRS
jgi:hypothetical protein